MSPEVHDYPQDADAPAASHPLLADIEAVMARMREADDQRVRENRAALLRHHGYDLAAYHRHLRELGIDPRQLS